MNRIVFHPEAEEELRASERFYEERGGRKLAASFLAHVETALRLVAENPQRFPSLPKYSRIQKCRVTRFPFSIYYVHDQQNVWIIGIAHNKRHPTYWKERPR